MIDEIFLPALGETMNEGKIVNWLVKAGDRVSQGDPIFEIETDKATIEVEATRDGVIRSILIQEGESAAIGTVVGYIAKSMDVPIPAAKPEPRQQRTVDVSADQELQVKEKPKASEKGSRLIASPRARRLADEHGIDIAMIEEGTGPKGRIVEADVKSYLEQRESVLPTSAAAIGAAATQTDQSLERVIPLEGTRKVIAERMSHSAQTAPHFTLTSIVDMTQLEASRKHINDRSQSDQPKLSTTVFIIAATAWALRHHPLINSTLKDEKIHLLPEIHIGVAVARKEGLIVPVLHDADRKTLYEIADELEDITSRARQGSLKANQITSSTFTISNLGMFGIEQFDAIINPPESAILTVGKIRRELVPMEDDSIEIKPLMRISLTCDHRIIDGAIGARFIQDLSEAMQTPALLLT